MPAISTSVGRFTCVALVSAALAAQVGPPVVNPANGHTYYLTTNPLTIAAAQNLALSLNGYLVAINDAAEDAWLTATFPTTNTNIQWIGLRRDGAGLPFTQWDSGEPLTYTNWCPGEPNNQGNEQWVHRNWCTVDSWNDIGNSSTYTYTAIIEIGGTYRTFGAGCAGSLGVPALVPLVLPSIGQTMTVEITNSPLGFATLLSGLSNTTSSFGALPLELTQFGMPGCFGRVSPDTTQFLGGNPTIISLSIPNNANLLGIEFFQQAWVLDVFAGNAANGVMSDAAKLRVGG